MCNFVVGGRDKRVAMYDCEYPGLAPNQPRKATLLWDVLSDDFVCACLSPQLPTSARACLRAKLAHSPL